ncbi:DUF3152 domain-containing protein [Streptomyces nitrosporeus]
MRRELIRGVGRHSRKGPETKGRGTAADGTADTGRAGPGTGRRRRDLAAPAAGDGHTPFRDAPQVRGGHPEQREPGGGWGSGPQPRHDGGPEDRSQEAYARQAVIRQLTAQQAAQRAAAGRAQTAGPSSGAPLIPGPRKEFVEAFGAEPAPPARSDDGGPRSGPDGDGGARGGEAGRGTGGGHGGGEPADGTAREGRGGWGRTLTGVAAAAVTTVLAVVVAGQVAQDSGQVAASQAADAGRDGSGDVSRDDRSDPKPQKAQTKPLSYEEKMAAAYPLAADMKASGEFEAVPGTAKAPGRGQKHRYRIDVEKGLGLDAELFAQAVQRTLNDDRSWAHGGAMTFERISSGTPDFVITLASPGTTADWCEKSGLDTTEDNVSCDSAATDRVMINAYRWAQGAATFGPDQLLAYRQMLINHEVGHRLGHNHESCRTPGALAPVMQQQTKTLELEGVKCRANPWVYPGS